MINLLRTDFQNQDFIALVRLLDADLRVRDGDQHAFYSQFNQIDNIRHVLVAYEADRPVGCGALKAYAPGILEIKRMFVLPEHRGKGVATQILQALEQWAAELSCTKCVLETGKNQPEAIALYYKNEYRRIPNYGQYAEAEDSLCFEKILR